MNARFWAFAHNSPVKLTLHPGQLLQHYAFYRHDEGWASEAQTWFFDGQNVERTIVDDGTDCDGRLTRTSDTFCPLADLASRIVPGEPPLPEWQDRGYAQRDYSAEAAGY